MRFKVLIYTRMKLRFTVGVLHEPETYRKYDIELSTSQEESIISINAYKHDFPEVDPEKIKIMDVNKMPLTGVELIAQEREEQLKKHGFSLEHDIKVNADGQLLDAIEGTIKGIPSLFASTSTPTVYVRKICNKSLKERLIIAGALIAAEIDRLNAIDP